MTSGNNGLLHKNTLEEFSKFLTDWCGFVQVPRGDHAYEVARFRKRIVVGDNVPLIIYRRERIDHLTIVNGFEYCEQFFHARGET
jgi:hypothetical protein